MKALQSIRVVLVRTFHSGNIGSSARAMKTMGLTDLYLVNPKDFQKDQALQMAMSADDVVENAHHVDSLYDAVSDCSVVIGSTARSRGYDLPFLNPEQAAMLALDHSSKDHKVALIFGPERMGLGNEDLTLCTHRVTIPTNPDYSSLNISAAVQTICYEVLKNSLSDVEEEKSELLTAFPTTENMEKFYTHLELTLNETGFINKSHPGEIMQKLRTLFSKAQMNEQELNIMRGILSSINRHHSKHD